jgi:hypothetical protein
MKLAQFINRIMQELEREHDFRFPLWMWLMSAGFAIWGIISFLQISIPSLGESYGLLYQGGYDWLLGEPIWVSYAIDIVFLIFLGWAVLYAFFGDHDS